MWYSWIRSPSTSPTLSAQSLGSRCQEGAVRGPEHRPLHLAAEHRQFVARHHDLQILVGLTSSAEHDQLQEQSEHDEEKERSMRRGTVAASP